jgi:flagellar capping protein FliD
MTMVATAEAFNATEVVSSEVEIVGRRSPFSDIVAAEPRSWLDAGAEAMTVRQGPDTNFCSTLRENDLELPKETSFGAFIGSSLAVRRLYPLCTKLGAVDVPIVIEGETGTGKEVVASIIDGKLVLEAQSAGKANRIDLSGPSSGTTLADLGLGTLQEPDDAVFSVNGITNITRSKNTGLDDVIGGLSIVLLDTGKVTLKVASDSAATRTKIDTFLSKLNGLTDYLGMKSSVTKEADGSYSRGPLNGYTLYTDLSSGFALDMSVQLTGVASGLPNRLYDIGITMDSNMHFVVSDSTKLDNALKANPSAVGDLFSGTSGVAQKVLNRLTPYVVDPAGPAKSFLDAEQDSIDSETRSINDNIKQMNESLAITEQNYRDQFTQLQAALIESQQLQSQMNSLFSYAGWS